MFTIFFALFLLIIFSNSVVTEKAMMVGHSVALVQCW
jgi:hypothetical protein